MGSLCSAQWLKSRITPRKSRIVHEKNVEALDKLSELTSFTMVLRTFMVLIYGFISKLIGGLEHEFYFSIYWE